MSRFVFVNTDIQFNIALTLIPKVGDILAKNLIAHCGSAEAIFKERKTVLEKIPGVGRVIANNVTKVEALKRAEEEVLFIEKHNITPLFYLDQGYPQRLLHCKDSPILLYYKGSANLNEKRVVSVVGTRSVTDYGRHLCNTLISDLRGVGVLVVSGLAYGVDILAHRACLENNIETIGVLAHGLDRVYPSSHKETARKMLGHGGLLTDFVSQTNPDRENFPKRNRVVAGMTDATIVVESKDEGGSLITADIANSYSRDVFAFPGRTNDPASSGCNKLIKDNKAGLIQSAQDVINAMSWDIDEIVKAPIQRKLFYNLSEEEERLVELMKDKEKVSIDQLCLQSKISMSKVSSLLLGLEFSGVVQSLPGKCYQLN